MFSLSGTGFIFLFRAMHDQSSPARRCNDMHAWTRFSPAGGVGASGVMTNDNQALFMHAMRALREIILVSF